MKGFEIKRENEKPIYLFNRYDVVSALAHAIYYTANPETEMCIPNCAYERAEKEFDDWFNDMRIKKVIKTLNEDDKLNKANEWHYPSKGEYPKDEKRVICILGDFENDNIEVGYYSQVEGDSKRWRFEDYDLPDDSENGWGVSAWKEIVLPELKENE